MGTAATLHSKTTASGYPSKATVLQLAVLIALVAALYVPVISDLALEWWTVDASSYGMLVPPIVLYIAYQQRHITLSIPARSDLNGLWLILVACSLYLLGRLAAEFFLSRLSFVVLLAGLTWTLWGFARFRTLLFVLILLATMVPLPGIVYNMAAAPLQLFASKIAADLSQLFGVSIYREGNIIYLANVALGVAEACSGLNSLASLVVASLLLGFIDEASMLGRILLFLLSLPLAIVVNVIRVTGTAVLADYRPEFAMGFYHTFSGWLIFVLGFFMLWLVAKGVFRLTRTHP
jgi:exosortase